MKLSPTVQPVAGQPNLILRAEGAGMLVAASVAYGQTGFGWRLFAPLFLVPDLTMVGFLLDNRLGATLYNLGHTYLGPALVAAFGFWFGAPMAAAIALIWAAHIGMDRLLGDGLKYPTGFRNSHLSGTPA